MLVTINLTGLLQLEMDTSQLKMRFRCEQTPSVGQVIERLAALRSEESDARTSCGKGDNSLGEFLIFLRRDGKSKSIAMHDGRNTALRDGDELTFVYRFSGG